MTKYIHRFALTVGFAIGFLVCASPAQAAITWNVTYQDIVTANGVGFNDATLGATRQATFESALDYVSDVINETGTVNLNVGASLTSGTGFLASGGTSYFFGGGFQQGIAQQNILGVGPGAGLAGAHGQVTFNFGFNWNDDLGLPAVNEFDLFTVSLHELGHVLGVVSLLNEDGTSPIGAAPSTTNTFSNFDQLLSLDDGTQLFNPSGEFIATDDLDMDGTADALQSNRVVFNGANATAANGGNPVDIFSPATFLDGSSLSHVVAEPNAVLQFSVGAGVVRREFTPIEIGVLQDIGFTNAAATAVPEPSTVLVLAVGAVAAGPLRRRMRRGKKVAA